MNFRCASQESERMLPFLDWGKILCAAHENNVSEVPELQFPFNYLTPNGCCYSKRRLFTFCMRKSKCFNIVHNIYKWVLVETYTREWEDSTAADNYLAITSWGCKVRHGPGPENYSVQLHPLCSPSPSFIPTTWTLIYFSVLRTLTAKSGPELLYLLFWEQHHHFTAQFASSCKFLLQ